MRATCYLRIARKRGGRFGFNATSKPSDLPLADTNGTALPTIQVKLNLDLKASAFGPDAELDIVVPDGAATVLVEVEGV